jgi:hypothetical protein
MNAPVDFHPDEMISAYLDGTAGPDERARVEEHLRTCLRCREMVDDFRSLAATAGREEPPPLPPDLAARIRRQVEEARRRASPARRPPWRSPFALAAATLAVASLVWVATRQQAPAPTSPPVKEPAVQKPAAQLPAANSSPVITQKPTAVISLTSEPITLDDLKSVLQKKTPGGSYSGMEDSSSLKKVQPGGDEAKPAEDEMKEDALQAAKGKDAPGAVFSQAGRSDGPAPAPRPKRSTGGGQEAQLALGSAKELTVSGEAPGPRSLVYETPEITVTLSEEGLVTLVLRGYACSADAASPAAEGGKPSSDPELASLFTQASSREILASMDNTGNPGSPTPAESAARPKTLTLWKSDGSVLYTVTHGDSPETAPPRPVLDLEAEIRRAIGSHFRKALEERCGPIPGDPALFAP